MLRYPGKTSRPDTNDTILRPFVSGFSRSPHFRRRRSRGAGARTDLLEDVLADYIETRRDIPHPVQDPGGGTAR